jgi:arginine:ornithine antiporter/lysine permease
MSCALSYFAPAFGAEGNAWQAIVGAFICLWIVHALILLGIRQADLVNVIGTIAKLAPIFIFIVAVLIAFNIPAFNLDFWGAGARRCHGASQERDTCDLVGFFVTIESASVVSVCAKKPRRYWHCHDLGVCNRACRLLCYTSYKMLGIPTHMLGSILSR